MKGTVMKDERDVCCYGELKGSEVIERHLCMMDCIKANKGLRFVFLFVFTLIVLNCYELSLELKRANCTDENKQKKNLHLHVARNSPDYNPCS